MLLNRYFKAAAEASDPPWPKENCFLLEAVASMMAGMPLRFWIPDLKMWFRCTITMESLIILDKKKALGHLSSMPCIDKAVPLRELLAALEDVGEATNAKHCVLISVSFIHPWEIVKTQQLARWMSDSLTMKWIWPRGPLNLKSAYAFASMRPRMRTNHQRKNVKRKKRMQSKRRKRRQGHTWNLKHRFSTVRWLKNFLFWMFSPRPWTVGNTWRFRNFKNTLTYWFVLAVSQSEATAVSFGNKLNLAKLADCKGLQTAWRVRMGDSRMFVCHLSIRTTSSNLTSSVIIVVRVAASNHVLNLVGWKQAATDPSWSLCGQVCVLNGNLELEPNQVVQIM